MKKPLLTLIGIASAIVFAGSPQLLAKDAEAFKGKVTSFDATSGALVVANKKSGETKTFTTDSSTKILKADGTDGTSADLSSAKRVLITAGASADKAAKVEIAGGKKDEGDKAAKKADKKAKQNSED